MQDLRELGDSSADAAAGEDAAREIDRVLEICVKQVRLQALPRCYKCKLQADPRVSVSQALPVYIAYPSDLVHFELPASCRKRLTSMPLQLDIPKNDADAEAYAIKEITQRVSSAKCPIILVDACTARHDVVGETREFVEQSGLPVFSTPMGKTSVDESYENKQFGGVYIGSLSHDDVKEVIEEKSDLVIAIGTLLSDFNTGSFTYRTKRETTIELHSDRTMIGFGTYEGVRMKHLIPKITDTLKKDKDKRLQQTESLLKACRASFNNDLPKPDAELATLSKDLIHELGGEQKVVKEVITQAHLWPRIGQFLRAGDKVIGETGTSSFGLMEVRFPQKAQFISQVLWGSIGYALPATLGVALGARQLAKEGKEVSGGMSVPGGRAILFIGDGSLQLTLQEIGTMIRQGVNPMLFVINNDGYQIEREIYGKEEPYNDIQPYNHKLLLDAFQPPPEWHKPKNPSHAHDPKMSQTAYHAVHTKAELDKLLKDEDFNAAKKCTLIELFVPRGDAPAALQRQAELSAKTNA